MSGLARLYSGFEPPERVKQSIYRERINYPPSYLNFFTEINIKRSQIPFSGDCIDWCQCGEAEGPCQHSQIGKFKIIHKNGAKIFKWLSVKYIRNDNYITTRSLYSSRS